MQQALHRSSLVPLGFIVESACYEVIKPSSRSGRPEASACVHRAERLPDVSIAAIEPRYPSAALGADRPAPGDRPPLPL